MSGYHDLPDPPGEWRVSINKENHVCYHKTVEGEKIILTPDQSQLASGWTVSLIGSDRWDQAPRFAEDVDVDEAVQTAHTLIESFDPDTDTEIEPAGFIERSTTDTDETDDGGNPEDETDSAGQADLSAFQ